MNCVIPGSFDPITKGHEDIVKRCSRVFDNVYLVVSINPNKNSLSAQKRAELAEKVFSGIKNIKVEINEGITAEYAVKKSPCVIVKGIRNGTDYEYEADMAKYNRELYGVETLLLPATDEYSRISSSRVRELIYLKCNIDKYVPKEIVKDINESYGE